MKQIATADPNAQAGAHNLEYLAFFLLFVWLGVEAWRRFGAPYGLFVLGSLAIPLSAPTVGYPLLSMPRFCLPLFPAFLALAAIASTERRNRAILSSARSSSLWPSSSGRSGSGSRDDARP